MLSLTKVWEAMLQKTISGRYNIWTESLKDEWELIKWSIVRKRRRVSERKGNKNQDMKVINGMKYGKKEKYNDINV